MLGKWIRPWRGEPLCGLVIAVSGEELICRAPGGFEFRVLLQDVRMGRAKSYPDCPPPPQGYYHYRLTEKGSGKLTALPELP